MSITAGELIPYQANLMPETDVVASVGGAIQPNGVVAYAQIAAADVVDYVSTNAGDTMNITTTGRDATGAIVTETKALNGTTVVAGTQTFQRILKVVLASSAAGTVTVKRHTGAVLLVTLLTTQLSAHCMFYNSQSSTSAGKQMYEKFFWKNTDATLALQNGTLTLTVDASTELLQGVATSINDSATVATRLTAPGGITFVGLSTAQTFPSLTAGSGIGCWMELNAPINGAAFMENFTSQISGGTT